MSGKSPRTARRNLGSAFAKERNEVVLADALEHEEARRAFAGVGDEVRPARWHRKGLARLQRHVLLRLLHEDADRSLQHVERVLHIVVVVPGHLLRLRDLQLADAESRPLRMQRPALDLVELARVLQCFHSVLAWSPEYRSAAPAARIAGTSRMRMPFGPLSMLWTSALTICSIVTSPRRTAVSRSGGSRSASA